MSIHESYAVFGLGRYGKAVAKELALSGADVIAVDRNRGIVNEAAADIPVCKCADVTDAEVLKRLGIESIDVVIIAMAESLEDSVMATMLCKEIGVKTVIAKCGNEMHQKILSRVGADKVVFPESESGIRLAKNLLSSGFVDMIELSDRFSVIELDLKPEWVGKTLINLNLRKKYSLNVIAVKNDNNICIDIDPEKPLEKNTKLIVIADMEKIGKLKQ